MFQRLLGRDRRANQAIVDALYFTIVAAARQPRFYSELHVPDTPLGRFEMMSLHMVLTLRRLRGANGPLRQIAQDLTDAYFLEVDHSLRELGIGDVAVPKRMKKLARMFYGRAQSYGDALEAGDAVELASALQRNIRPDLAQWDGAAELANYVATASSSLEQQSLDRLAQGELAFPKA